jgi:hypothetical protein
MSKVESRRKRIHTLFLHPVESYSLEEAARLLGITCKALIREAEQDNRADYRLNSRWFFRWRQVAYIAFRTWTLAEIQEALGAESEVVLPPLLRLREVTVRLPEYIVRGMEIAARDDRTTLDDWLTRELVDFAGTVVNHMDRRVPGFRRAYLFPGRE